MSARDVKKRLPDVLAATHIEDVAGARIRTLSHGYKQRVGVAQAIIHQPKLLILDEPTRGLDPVQIVEMRQMIRELKKSHTVLISSHILPEISETCDRLLVLGKGVIVGSGTEDELSKKLSASSRIVVGARGDTDALVAVVSAVPGVVSVRAGDVVEGAVELDVVTSTDVRAAVCRALVEKGHDVVKLDRAQHQLESIFLELVAPPSAPPASAPAPVKEAAVASN
jgi:ABC-2 type transport system ATP-binding protein